MYSNVYLKNKNNLENRAYTEDNHVNIFPPVIYIDFSSSLLLLGLNNWFTLVFCPITWIQSCKPGKKREKTFSCQTVKVKLKDVQQVFNISLKMSTCTRACKLIVNQVHDFLQYTPQLNMVCCSVYWSWDRGLFLYRGSSCIKLKTWKCNIFLLR